MNNDDIKIQRITNAALNNALHLDSLQETLLLHRAEMGDDAIWLSHPHTQEETDLRIEELGFVSGYCHLRLAEISETDNLNELLASRLTTAIETRVEYESIWALGDVVVIYVRSKN